MHHEHKVEMLPLNPPALAAEFDRRSADGWELAAWLPVQGQSLVGVQPVAVLMCVFRREATKVVEA